ncbi:MAG TPA: CARDB domain-containing protein, partial [Candidatus Polarisedimenticolia bacterium]|nr:CARDB domain-containing protein [Candidatus Polarisedimenticolia bacterium]
GTPVQMGAKWTPAVAGTYTLVCEANPQKTFAEATYENNTKQASFTAGAVIQPAPAIETAPGRLPGPIGRDEEEQPEEKGIILCPECFNPQPEPPGFNPDPPPDDPPFNPVPPGGEMVPLSGEGEAPSFETPDLLPELKLQGNGVLFPLQIRIRNQGAASATPSRARLTWQLTCQKSDGTSAQTYPVGPREQVVSVPAIAADQFHEVSLTGSKQYCEAPMAAVRGGLVCDEECYVRAVADTDGMVHESDEINNAVAIPVKRK